MLDYGEQHISEKIICPHCDYEFIDDDDGLSDGIGEDTRICPECEKEFKIYAEYSIRYRSYRCKCIDRGYHSWYIKEDHFNDDDYEHAPHRFWKCRDCSETYIQNRRNGLPDARRGL